MFSLLEHVFEGNIQVSTNTHEGIRNNPFLFPFYASIEVNEAQQGKAQIQPCYLSGAFDIYKGSKLEYGSPDYAYETRHAELTLQNGLPVLRMESGLYLQIYYFS